MNNNEVIVPAIDRCLDVIEYLYRADSPKTIKEMSEELEIPIASLFRIVKNLTVRNYLSKMNGHTSAYTIGYMIPQIASKYSDRFVIAKVARDYLRELTKNTNQTAQLMVYNGMDFIYIDQVLATASLQFLAMLYQPMEVNKSAGAKCILANMKKKEQQEILKSIVLEKQTEYTITDMNEFKEELAKIKEQGWGSEIEEFHIGLACLAAPVYYDNECIGAVGITGGVENYNDGGLEILIQQVQETAEKISNAIMTK